MIHFTMTGPFNLKFEKIISYLANMSLKIKNSKCKLNKSYISLIILRFSAKT